MCGAAKPMAQGAPLKRFRALDEISLCQLKNLSYIDGRKIKALESKFCVAKETLPQLALSLLFQVARTSAAPKLSFHQGLRRQCETSSPVSSLRLFMIVPSPRLKYCQYIS